MRKWQLNLIGADRRALQRAFEKKQFTYDILAFKGGAKLYSRLSAIYVFVTEADGSPTQGVKDQYADMKRELDGDEAQFKQLTSSDLASLNEAAKKLDAPIVVVASITPANSPQRYPD